MKNEDEEEEVDHTHVLFLCTMGGGGGGKETDGDVCCLYFNGMRATKMQERPTRATKYNNYGVNAARVLLFDDGISVDD